MALPKMTRPCRNFLNSLLLLSVQRTLGNQSSQVGVGESGNRATAQTSTWQAVENCKPNVTLPHYALALMIHSNSETMVGSCALVVAFARQMCHIIMGVGENYSTCRFNRYSCF